MLEKTFNPNSFEDELYNASAPYFAPTNDESKTPYTIMMPPPNVTGSLHLGHALTYTLQDVLIRFKRATSFDTLWQPGTDHAGIATQMVVERQLNEQGIKRQDLGREKFLEKVWGWKEYSGNTIVNQQKRLRISTDWQRSRFTMDEGLSKAVVEVFVKLYKDGLIYRDKRLVNWDTKMLTAISDLEVVVKEEKSDFWYLKYPLADGSENIIVATTRPETMFGDTAVAVHPDDERYKHLIGKHVRIPLTDRVIPIIADEYCDMEKGSGAVKITPAHDFNDFEVGKRHNLERINVLDQHGHMNEIVPSNYQGMYFLKARKALVQALEEQGIIEKTEETIRPVPYGERSDVEIQPYLTDQWYVDAKTLAEPALEVVKNGKVKFIPQNYENTYFEWLNNIQPWCISRQIWWGHQIPAWFSDCGEVFVATSENEAYKEARAKLGDNVKLTRETDVLDTWFSSALWPFTTLGWPENNPDLKRYYPTDTLVTGFDIIFFWVARMVMMGLYFMKDVPFKTVYIHALVRDEKGQKMSKSKGNIIDPLILMDKYGSDALRFTLAALAAPGRDIKLGESRVEGYRNFCTKIWNSARFLEMNECVYDANFKTDSTLHPIDKWLVAHIDEVKKSYTAYLNDYRFDLAANELYQSFWYNFCDQYLEALKVLVSGELAEQSKRTAMWALFEYLKLMHPIMPSITSYLAKYFGMHECLTNAKIDSTRTNISATEVHTLWQLVDEVRSLKGLLNLSGGLQLKGYIIANNEAIDNFNKFFKNTFQAMARITDLELWKNSNSPANSLPCVVGDYTVYIDFGSALDINQAKQILEQKRDALTKETEHLSKKLANEAYKNAKPEQWADDNALLNAKQTERAKLASLIDAM
jgi:valyl-tRNA synthetase